MGQHIIEAPDGSRHVIEAPDDATPQEIETFANESLKPSQMESFGRGALQGAALGFSDEAYAALSAIGKNIGFGAPKGDVRHVRGTPEQQAKFSSDYSTALDDVRAANSRAQQENPGTYFAGGFAGGMVTAPFLPVARGATVASDIGRGIATGSGYGAVAGFGSGSGGVENRLTGAIEGAAAGGVAGGVLSSAARGLSGIRRAYANRGEAGAYGTIADDLPHGVDSFADQISTGASRGNIATNRATLDILGEEMQRAGGDVAAAQQATIARISQQSGVTPATAAAQIRRLADVHADNPLLLAEQPAISGSDAAQRLRQSGNIDLDQLGRTQESTTQATLDYLANNGNSQSAQNVRNAISERQETLAPAMRRVLSDIGPQVQTGPRSARPAQIEDTGQLIDQARQLGHAEYQSAYAAPIRDKVSLYLLPRVLQHYGNVAAGRSGEYADAMQHALDQFYIRTPNGQRLAMHSLQQLQDARGALRGQMNGYAASGRNDLARVIQPMYQRITRVMEAMSPQWAVANRRWADMRFDEVAQKLGDAFSTKAGPQFRKQVQQFEGMAPQAQNIVRIHVLQKLFDKMDNLGDTHSVSKLFSNDQSRAMMRTLFGDDAAVSFTRAVRDQRVAESSSRMMSNSATHRRGVAQKQKDAETGLVAAVENANTRGVRNWLLERLTQVLTERRNRPMADILTTPMSDTANVARHVYNMRRQEDRLRQLDQPSAHVDRTIRATGAVIGNSLAPASSQRQDGDDRRASGLDIKPYMPISEANADDPTEPPNLPGVPQGLDGEPGPDSRTINALILAGKKDRARNALVRYGDDTTIIPGLSELAASAWQGLQNAGDVAMAFGPMGEALDAPMAGLNALGKSMRAKVSAPSEADTYAAAMSALSQQTAEVQASRAAAAQAAQAAERAAYTSQRAAAARQSGMTGTVPATQNIDDIVAHIEANRAGRSVPGRQGMMSVEDQTDLIRSGGPQPIAQGPWGPNMNATVSQALARAYEVRQRLEQANSARRGGQTATEMQDRPGIGDALNAYKSLTAEAKILREALPGRAARNQMDRDVKAYLRQRLKDAETEIGKLRSAIESGGNDLPPPEPSQMRTPRIFNRDAE